MRKHITTFIVLAASLWLMTGCDNDVPTAMYNQPQKQTTPPVITGLNPAEALAGVNYITVNGEHFSDTLENNKVYVDGYFAEITEHSTTMLKIRRPNRIGDSTTVKVVNTEARDYTIYEPYKITSVYTAFGDFVTGADLSAIAADGAGNVYVIQKSPRTVFKITPQGEKTTVAEASKVVTDATFSPDGKLILLVADKSIKQLDLGVSPAVESEWFKSAKRVSFGDFDSYGNLYAGGSKTDMVVVSGGAERLLGVYASDEITCIKVYNDFVYLAAKLKNGTPEVGIWKHEILDATGALGEREPFFDWTTTGAYADSTIQDMAFSQDGKLFVGTNLSNPILEIESASSFDIYYKTILPAKAVQIEWGTGNDLYMLQGGTNKWNVIRIDMGMPGAL